MKFIAQWEWGNRTDGGYTNNPTDTGGETKYGIAKRSHPKLDIKNLKLADAYAIYKTEYYDSSRAASFDWPMALAVFDCAVNLGVDDSDRWLKVTKEFKSFMDLREKKYRRIVEKNPSQAIFLKGWLNRLSNLKKFADTTIVS